MILRQWLLIRSGQPENAYGRFALELLKFEGLNGFEFHDLDEDPFPEFGPGDLIVLSRCMLRREEADALIQAVERGARLVALHPCDALSRRLGWTGTMRVAWPGWVRLNGAEAIQTHVPIVLCRPEGSRSDVQSLAQAILPNGKDSGCPAIVSQAVGQGRAALFFYDVPKAVARIRFGQPDLSSLVTLGLWNWTHASDLFEGHVDDRAAHLPQADLHSQLLARVISELAPWPLARLWYYDRPETRTAIVFTSDDDWSTPKQFDELSQCIESHGGRASFYLMSTTHLPDAKVVDLRSRGHTFSPHVNAVEDMEDAYFRFPPQLREETRVFRQRYGATGLSIQTHCAPWAGYMSWVPFFVAEGYRLLLMYISAPVSRLNRYMCGSGRPMKFVEADGKVLDCWQQPLIAYDDAALKKRISTEPAALVEEFERFLLKPSVDEHYSSIGMLSHPISFSTYSRPYIEGVLGRARDQRVPIYNGDEWCQFHDRRDKARITQSRRSDGSLICTVQKEAGALTVMLCWTEAEGPSLDVTVNGRRMAVPVVARFGTPHVMIHLEDEGAQQLILPPAARQS